MLLNTIRTAAHKIHINHHSDPITRAIKSTTGAHPIHKRIRVPLRISWASYRIMMRRRMTITMSVVHRESAMVQRKSSYGQALLPTIRQIPRRLSARRTHVHVSRTPLYLLAVLRSCQCRQQVHRCVEIQGQRGREGWREQKTNDEKKSK